MNILTKIKNFLYGVRREIIIFLLLLFTLLSTLPGSLHGWNSAWYALDYSMGFGSRLFIGSFLRLFYPDFLPVEAVYSFVILAAVLLLILIAYILGYALRQNADSPAKAGLVLIIVLYLLCPGSPAYLWTTENIGRFDMYLLLLTLFAAVICFKVHSISLRLLLFTLTGFAALSIHQVFMFIFFPLLFTLFAETATERMFQSANTNMLFQKKHIALGAVCLVSLAIGFLYFQAFSGLNVSGIDELINILSARTNLEINEVALNYEYFTSTAVNVRELVLNQLGERIRYGLVTAFMLTPLFAVYGYLWLSVIRNTKGQQRFKYIFLLLSWLCFVPAFVLAIDWGRWFGAFLTVLALQIIILAAKKDDVILSALGKLSTAYYKHPYLFIAAGIWAASLHKFEATLLPDAPVFFTSLYRLYSTIF